MSDVLKNELANDPLARGYSGMTDQQAADSLNTADRQVDGPAVGSAIIEYLLTNNHRGENLFGRIAMVAEAKTGDSVPMDDTETGITMTARMIAGAKALLKYADNENTVPLSDTTWDDIIQSVAGGGANAQCIGPTHKTALQALGEKTISRAEELGLSNVRPGTVAEARAS